MTDRHGYMELPATYIGKQPPKGTNTSGGSHATDFPIWGGGSSDLFIKELRNDTIVWIKHTAQVLKHEYDTKSAVLVQTIEHDLVAVRHEGSLDAVPPEAGVLRELNSRNSLLLRKTTALHTQTTIALEFYGSDPLDKTNSDFIRKAATMGRIIAPGGKASELWERSYQAAYSVKLLTQAIEQLNHQSIAVHHLLATVQAEERARIAQEAEAQRVATEHLRLMQQAEARRAAEQEAKRYAEEQTRIAAKQQIAAEQARIAVLAEVQRQAEQVRLEAEQPPKKQLNEHSRAPDAHQETLNAAGSVSALGPAFGFAGRAIVTEPAVSLALQAGLRYAVASTTAALAALSTPMASLFALMLLPSSLGKSDRYSISVPLSQIAPDHAQDLEAIAMAQGELDLTLAIGAETKGERTEIFVAALGDVPLKVPVRYATFDPSTNTYTVTLPDVPAITLTWTPAATPGNSSTLLPAEEPDIQTYTGATITPTRRMNIYTDGITGFKGIITVFPDNSGIPPLYVVFNSPYEGATTTGEHSGRAYNPEQTGGPTLDMEWELASASQEGTDIVKLHTSKFLPSDANKVMIDRLERILRGEFEMTDTDKRFYTHEIREFERFKAMGYGDTETPDANSPIWNNVHTATLEDFKLKDDPSLLYTPEALAAAAKQDERDYQLILKEI